MRSLTLIVLLIVVAACYSHILQTKGKPGARYQQRKGHSGVGQRGVFRLSLRKRMCQRNADHCQDEEYAESYRCQRWYQRCRQFYPDATTDDHYDDEDPAKEPEVADTKDDKTEEEAEEETEEETEEEANDQAEEEGEEEANDQAEDGAEDEDEVDEEERARQEEEQKRQAYEYLVNFNQNGRFPGLIPATILDKLRPADKGPSNSDDFFNDDDFF